MPPATQPGAALPNRRGARLRRAFVTLALVLGAVPGPVLAQAQQASDAGLVTRPSTHGAAATLQRFTAAVRAEGWVVFAEVDHAAASAAAGLSLKPRTVVLFGNPRAGTPAMAAHPTLAIDLPMRVLVWENDQGQVLVTRSTGADISARVLGRHGIPLPPQAQQASDSFIESLVRKAADQP
jgi:uncharacterized protein (DUF302 family)